MRSIAQLFALSGRTALVTGAAGHIGLAIGQALVEQGATVAVADIDAAACARRATELCTYAGRTDAAFAVPVDLADEASTRAAVHAAARGGTLDLLIHNAGYTGATKLAGWAEPFAQQTLAAWRAAHAVNVDAAFVLAQEAAPLLRRAEGAIILVASIYGFVAPQWSLYDDTAMANPAAYGASKGGLIQLGRYLATTLAPVRVNCISPGGVARGQDPRFVERYVARTPLARMANEEDLKGAVAYLASAASAYVTGHNLVVDGGWSTW